MSDVDEAGAPGLGASQARERLARDGPNELTVTSRDSVGHVVLELLKEPLFLLLFTAAGLYAWLGDSTEALALLASAAVAAGITAYQRYRTERVLVAMRDLSSPRALVLRDGHAQRIATRDVVRGDVLLLREGDRVAADATLREAEHLRVDESLLTGEAAGVPRFAGGRVFANTLVTGGQGTAVVMATGARTEFGLIGGALEGLHDPHSPLQRDARRLARVFGGAGLLLCLLVVLGLGWFGGRWTEGLLRGLTLAMAILPEEFPLVITVFLTLGAWRLSRHGVLTRKPGAIEALGAATVLCVDKTGTLTENRMRVVEGLPMSTEADGMRHLADTLVHACEPEPFDPMERACHDWVHSLGGASPAAAALRRRYPLRPGRLVLAHTWARPEGGWRLDAKGAPEHVLAMCRFDERRREAVLAQLHELTQAGRRVLGVAQGEPGTGPLPVDPADVPMDWLGLVAFEDPLRPEVAAAVGECHRAGIRLLMITGGHPQTAVAVARAAGLSAHPRAVTGDELAAWSDERLASEVLDVDVVARAQPLTKLRLVQVLQGRGEVVAMTGDGVNDAPALRAAHIGVAMGERGSDVAREAAGLVLLHDDFGSLVAAVRRGRRIFENLRQALLYVLAVHVPMVGMSLLPLALGAPPMLLPLHVMFLEFVIDPTCSLAFEAEHALGDPMARPPRSADEHVLGWRHVGHALVQGVVALTAAGLAFGLARWQGVSTDGVRAATVTAIVLTNLLLLLQDRNGERHWLARMRAPNPLLWAMVGGTALAWTLVLAVPELRSLFRLEVAWDDLAFEVLPGVGLAAVMLEGLGRVWPQQAGASRDRRRDDRPSTMTPTA